MMTPSNAMSMSREGYEYMATFANSVRERFLFHPGSLNTDF